MADFRTHITTSAIVGTVYGAAGYVNWGLPIPTCMLAAGLCGVAGMLPDVDSESGVPLRETMAFGAAVIPMLMLERFQHLGLSHESMVLAGGCIYIVIRFGLGELMRRCTVHRGMWPSIPAAALAGTTATLICSCSDTRLRMFKATAVVIGYLTHLLLDELYAVEWYRGRLRFKNTFGTAFKLFSRSLLPNFVTYGLLFLAAATTWYDPMWTIPDRPNPRTFQQVAHDLLDGWLTMPAEQGRRRR